jgi:site-specific recombinase XerD
MSDFEFEDLQSWFIGGKVDKIEPNSIISYRQSIKRFGWFLEYANLDYTALNKRSDIVIDITGSEDINTANTLLDYFAKWMLHEKEYAHSTIETTYSYLREFLIFLYREGYVEENLTESFVIGSYIDYGDTLQEQKWGDDYVAIDPNQHKVMLENVGAPKFRNKIILNLLYESGMRRSEIAALEKHHLTLKINKVKVPEIKSEDTVPIRISDKLATQLKIWMDVRRETYINSDSKYVFVTDDIRSTNGMTPRTVGVIVRNAADALNDQQYVTTSDGTERAKYTTHSYRHGFAEQYIISSGESSIYDLSKIMNHKDISTTKRYLSDDREEYLMNETEKHAPRID